MPTREKKNSFKVKKYKNIGFNQNLKNSGGLTEKSVNREERLKIGRSPDKSGAVTTLSK